MKVLPSRIKATVKSIALEKRYENEIAGMKSQKRETEQENKRCKERMAQLGKGISGRGPRTAQNDYLPVNAGDQRIERV
ncbi:MAG: hypothetical protein FWG94_09865 [Oscillospiraceae bacterium]|nr:hypothetical protein [Oscillospiraceae bacterium]